MRKNSVYSAHPGFAMEDAALKFCKDRTGRTLDEWIGMVKKSGTATEKARIAWLKQEHGVTTNYALWIARRVDGGGTVESYDPDSMVEQMFAGKKAVLLPVYQRLLAMALALGNDVRVSPGKTIVPFYRKHVFAQVKPATNTRIDLGFAFRDMQPAGKLISTGGFDKGDRITHRIPLTSVEEIDKEVGKWLKHAYQLDV
jgi:hypothetical protein